MKGIILMPTINHFARKINQKFIIIIRIRLIIICIICSILISLFFDSFGDVWNIACALLVFIFVIIYNWYIPKKYESYSYIITSNDITLFSGILFSRKYFIKTNSIQYIITFQSIIQKIFKLKTIVFYTPGSKVYIRCIDYPALNHIFKLLQIKM